MLTPLVSGQRTAAQHILDAERQRSQKTREAPMTVHYKFQVAHSFYDTTPPRGEKFPRKRFMVIRTTAKERNELSAAASSLVGLLEQR